MKINLHHKAYITIFCIGLFLNQSFTATQESLDFDLQQFFNQFLTNNQEKTVELENDMQINNDELQVKINKVEQESAKKRKEYNTYLLKYFPKVFVVRERYLQYMTPEDIATSLQEVVDMLADTPWVYLQSAFNIIKNTLNADEKKVWKDLGCDLEFLLNKYEKENLNTIEIRKYLKTGCGFWEFVVDQLAFYIEFLQQARVTKEKQIYLDEEEQLDWFSFTDNSKNKNSDTKLLDYLRENGLYDVCYNLYALSFDYRVKLFLEGILNQDLQQASRYNYDLKELMEKLIGSKFESERQENMQTYRELLDLLKQKTRPKKKNDGKKSYFDEMMEYYDMD